MKKYRKMSSKKLLKVYSNLTFRAMTYGRGYEEAELDHKEMERRGLS